MIKLDNINIKYTDTLIENSSIIIPTNKMTVIKGKSGIGKTTLLYRIALISDDTSYNYYYDDIKLDLTNDNLRSDYRKNNIGFALQENDIINHLSVMETLKYYAHINQREVLDDEAMELIKLMRLDIDVNQNIMTLSLGERKRLSIACALIKKPKVLILDEPTASLDNDNSIIIFDILKEISKDMTVVLTSHSEVANQYGDVLYTINNHQIIKIKGDIDNKDCLVNNSEKIKFSFIKEYVKTYFNYYRFNYSLMIMILLISFLATGMLFSIVNNNREKSKKLLIGQYENKLIVTNDNDSKYIDEDYSKFITLNKDNAYPLYQMSTTVNNDEVYIIPYFDSDDFGDYLESSIAHKKDGLYVDSQTYYALSNSNMDITVKNNNYIYHLDYTINGVFKDSKNEHYTSVGDRFIYMPYSMMENIYKQSKGNNEYVAYVLIYDSYDELSSDKTQLSKQYNINDTFIDSSLMNKLNNYYIKIETMIITIILFITLLIDIILNNQLCFQRKKELAILKIIGLRNKDVLYILMNEYLFESLSVIGVTLIIELLLLVILNIISFRILVTIIIVDLLFFVILLIERFILSRLFVSKIKMEYVLRND